MKSNKHDKKNNNKGLNADTIGKGKGMPGTNSDFISQLKTGMKNRPESKQAAQLQAGADQHTTQLKDEREGTSGMDNDLATGVEQEFAKETGKQVSLAGTKVTKNSSKPADVNAEAVAQGNEVDLAAGKGQHEGHELTHILQQKADMVKPTKTVNGTPVNDDRGLEAQADRIGAKAKKYKGGGETSQLKTIENTENVSPSKEAVSQRMAEANLPLEQVGGTCGIYSLYMAISSFDRTITIKRVLEAANEVGTTVGEFMDVNGLRQTAIKLGYSSAVVSFNDEEDMVNKLKGTGNKGTLMGYSMYDVDAEISQAFPQLNALKHLFSHWSTVEGITGTKLKVRDPNSPGNVKEIEISAFFQANQSTESKDGKFDFKEFQDKVGASVSGLKDDYNQLLDDNEIDKSKREPLPDELPKLDLNLKGKILTVSA